MSSIRAALLWLVVLLTLLEASILFVAHAAAAAHHAPALLDTVANSVFAVDSTDDTRALGYTDSRKIVRDAAGNLYIGYRKKYQGVPRIFVAKSTDNGQSWQVVNQNRPIETVGAYTQRVPSLAIDANNTLHVVWYGLDANTPGADERQIKYVRSTDGGVTWSTWRNVAVVPGYEGSDLWQEHPTIYNDVHNVLYVVWQGGARYHSQIKLSKSVDGGKNWSLWRDINAVPSESYSRPALVASHDGASLYLVAFRNIPNPPQIVWSRSLDGGTTWTPWGFVAPNSQDQRYVSIAIDKLNRLHVVWRQQPIGAPSTAKAQAHYARFDGTQWTMPEVPAAQPELHQFFPSITVDPNNNPWLVWTATAQDSGYPTEDPTTGLIYYTTQANGVWHTPVRLTNTTSTYASLIRQGATNPASDVVWLENQATAGGFICHYSLERVLNAVLPTRHGACEVVPPAASPPTPTATLVGTPTKTPKPTMTPTPTKTPKVTNTPSATKLPTATQTPTLTKTPKPPATATKTPTPAPATGSISGKIANSQNLPLANVKVNLYRQTGSSWKSVTSVKTNSTGDYRVNQLTVGLYHVRFTVANYNTEYYAEASTLATATDVQINANLETTGINAILTAATTQAAGIGNLSGQIRDAVTDAPIADATLTLYQVPDWRPRHNVGDSTDATCESPQSKAPDTAWRQPAPTELGEWFSAELGAGATEDQIKAVDNPQQTDSNGAYAWTVSVGCWYIVVEAVGYTPLVSPVIGTASSALNVNIALVPQQKLYLPLIGH